MPAITHPYPPNRQRGAVLMVMLIIMVIGAITILVSSLNSSALNNIRNQTTADALAKAKDALIGYAASNPNRPGELPCPDNNNDGVADVAGGNCNSLTGWLPWQTLGLPDLRDANGDRLWYAVADPFRTNYPAVLNSDTPTANPAQMLTVLDGATGATLESGVIAIVLSPGTALTGESRSPSDNNATNVIQNYLESENANFDTVFKTANDKLVPAPTPTLNDRLLTINYNALFLPVEMRIARETRSCLDSYAASSANKYPWAAPVSDPPSFTSTDHTYFGRIPYIPATSGVALTPTISALLAQQVLLNNVIAALAAYVANPDATNTSSLLNAALNLINSANNSLTSSVNNTVDNAGDKARNLANGSGVTLATVNTAISNANTALNNALTTNGYSPSTFDPTMQAVWPLSCTIFSNPSSYFWTSWSNLVFYQIAVGYVPKSSANCTATTCLAINGSGNPAGGNGTYHAAVLVARKPINGQVPSPGNTATYLEGSNVNPGATPPTFETYAPSDPGYSTVNDLVLCLDGKVNCI